MGLDLVEILLDVEDTFGVCIPSEDYEQLKTVGALHQYIVRQLSLQRQMHHEHAACPSIPAFVATRNALTSLVGVERRDVRPKTPLTKLLPRRGRRRLWRKLAEATHIHLPELVLPQVLRVVLMGCPVVVAVYSLGALLHAVEPWALLGIVLAATVLPFGLFIASRPLASEFPVGYSTVAEIIRSARPPHYPPRHAPEFPSEERAVWENLVSITVDVLNVPRESITPETRWIEDMNAG